MPIPCKILAIRPNVKLPRYATLGAAGMDVFANTNPLHTVNPSTITIAPGESKLIPLGFALELESGMEVQVRSKSGIALRHKVVVLNSPGTIDSDYRGEISVLLMNFGDEPMFIQNGDAVAQIVFGTYTRVELIPAGVLSQTDRGEGGFGSTGIRL